MKTLIMKSYIFKFKNKSDTQKLIVKNKVALHPS